MKVQYREKITHLPFDGELRYVVNSLFIRLLGMQVPLKEVLIYFTHVIFP